MASDYRPIPDGVSPRPWEVQHHDVDPSEVFDADGKLVCEVMDGDDAEHIVHMANGWNVLVAKYEDVMIDAVDLAGCAPDAKEMRAERDELRVELKRGCAACGHVGPESPPSGEELPIVAGALDAQARAERERDKLRNEAADLRAKNAELRAQFEAVEQKRVGSALNGWVDLRAQLAEARSEAAEWRAIAYHDCSMHPPALTEDERRFSWEDTTNGE